MSAKKTGSEVLSYCGQCKMDLMSVIVAMNGASIARVQCRTCRKERAYRAPKGVKEPGAEGTIKSSSTSSSPRAPRASTQEKGVPVEIEWQNMLTAASQKNARKLTYSPKEVLAIGDIVDHPSFGPGVVMKLGHPNKVEIIFRSDVKILVHSLGK